MPHRHGHHHHAGHHHHGVGHHHHGVGHHHHGVGHHPHNIHHHHPVRSVGTPMGVAGSPGVATPAGHVQGLGICLGMFGIFFLFSGVMMMSFGFSFTIGIGIVGIIFLILGLCSLIAGGVFCRRGRLQQQQAIVNQQAGGVTTLMYGPGPPGSEPIVVQQQQPGVPTAYGQPGVLPTVQPQAPGAAIVYGPGGVAYHPQVQPGFQPQVQPGFQPQVQPGFQPQVQPGFQPGLQYPAAVPYSPQGPETATPQPVPLADPAAPPPTYEDAVNPYNEPPQTEKDATIVV